MSYSFKVIKCPECGASLNVEEDRKQIFCSYCGTKILITNENEFVYRRIDEAEVKRAETERLIRLKQLELEEQAIEDAKRVKRIKTKITIIVGLVGFLMMLIGNYFNNESLFDWGFIAVGIIILTRIVQFSANSNKKIN